MSHGSSVLVRETCGLVVAESRLCSLTLAETMGRSCLVIVARILTVYFFLGGGGNPGNDFASLIKF